MSNIIKEQELSPLPAIGWKFSANTAPWIVVWSVTIVSQRIRKPLPRGMREAHRIRYRYKEQLWSMFIPEDVLQERIAQHYYDTDKEWECGRSEVCFSLEEARDKFEKIRVSHLSALKASIDRCHHIIDFYSKEISKLNGSMQYTADEMEKLGTLIFPEKELNNVTIY